MILKQNPTEWYTPLLSTQMCAFDARVYLTDVEKSVSYLIWVHLIDMPTLV